MAVAPRVAISIDPLAATRTKNEEKLSRSLRAREAIISVFAPNAQRRYVAQKNSTGPSRALDRGISFFIFRRTKTEANNLFRRAPAKTGGRPPSWPTAARPERTTMTVTIGRDGAIPPVFRPCENATSENSIFHRGYSGRRSLVTRHLPPRTPRERKRFASESPRAKNFIRTFTEYYRVTTNFFRANRRCVLPRQHEPRRIVSLAVM